MGSYHDGRSRGRNYGRPPDRRHEAIKTGLQAFGLFICLKLLLPVMFPREEPSDDESVDSRRRNREPPNRQRSGPIYESYESLPGRRSSSTSERRETRRIAYEEPRDRDARVAEEGRANDDGWDDATVVDSDAGRSHRRRRRNRGT
jgi:hypothetical protein